MRYLNDIQGNEHSSYNNLALSIKNCLDVIKKQAPQHEFFILLHSQDLEIYKDQLEIGYNGSFSIYGVIIIGSIYAEKGKIQPLPISILNNNYLNLTNPLLPVL